MDSLPTELEPGTIVEFDDFSCISIGRNRLLVFESSWNIVCEGDILYFTARGGHDWAVSLTHNENQSHLDYWIHRDWNGHIKTRYWDDSDWLDWFGFDWPDEWDRELDERLYMYEQYDPDDY